MGTTLWKTNSPIPRSHHLSIASQLRVRTLLHQSWSGDWFDCVQATSAPVAHACSNQCPEDTVSLWSSLISGSSYLAPSFSDGPCALEIWAVMWCPVYSHPFHRHLGPAVSPAGSFCANHCPLHEETLLMGCRNCIHPPMQGHEFRPSQLAWILGQIYSITLSFI